MNFLKAAPTVFCAAVIAAAFSPSVKADDWNQKTVMTFSQPVETPGVHMKGWAVLPAGTYVFKLLGSPSDRHIVQIFNQDETVLYATVLAIPNYRLQATGKTVLTFRETPPGEPEVLRAWFYPGKNFGEEFVYPKAKSARAGQRDQHARSLHARRDPGRAEEPRSGEPVVVQLKQAPVLAVQPTGEDVEIAQVVTAAARRSAGSDDSPDRRRCRKQPVRMPLIGLFGLLALGAAFTLKFVRARAVSDSSK